MSRQIAVRLPDDDVAFIDAQVSSGAVRSRAELVSRAIRREQRRVVAERDLATLGPNPYEEFDAMHAWAADRAHPELD